MDLGFITPPADRVCVPVPPKRGGTWNRTLRFCFRPYETGWKQAKQDANPPEVTCSGYVEQERRIPEILIVHKRTSCFNGNETERISREGSVALPPLSPALGCGSTGPYGRNGSPAKSAQFSNFFGPRVFQFNQTISFRFRTLGAIQSMTIDDRDKTALMTTKQVTRKPEQIGPFVGTSTTKGTVAKTKASMPVLGAWQAVNGTNRERSDHPGGRRCQTCLRSLPPGSGSRYCGSRCRLRAWALRELTKALHDGTVDGLKAGIRALAGITGIKLS